MAIEIPNLDDRTYDEVLADVISRIPVHNPEWTNFRRSDPGVTLIEVFAHLYEHLAYRANLVPERNRLVFLDRLGLPLRPGVPARSLVAFEAGPGALTVHALSAETEVRAGRVPFATTEAVEVMPLVAHAFVKRDTALVESERALHETAYAGLLGGPTDRLVIYETVAINEEPSPVALADTIDGCVWVALALPSATASRLREQAVDRVRQLLAGRAIKLGIIPAAHDRPQRLTSMGSDELARLVRVEVVGGDEKSGPMFRTLTTRADTTTLLKEPSVVEVALPSSAEDLRPPPVDPLLPGIGEHPPSLEGSQLGERIVVWLRVSFSSSVAASLSWVGINCTRVVQQARVVGEFIGTGDGTARQTFAVAHSAVLPGSVRIAVIDGETVSHWLPTELIDLAPAEGAEGSRVFQLDPHAGQVRFGDGARGGRVPVGASLYADYAYCIGDGGNLSAGSITVGPGLPPGVRVSHPTPSRFGRAPEASAEGQRRLAAQLRHRERLVTRQDFIDVLKGIPDADLARVEVLAGWLPEAGEAPQGVIPGVVTIMVIPRRTSGPGPVRPDQALLSAVCAYARDRRLVTTELVIAGPEYVDIALDVGVEYAAGETLSVVDRRIRAALRDWLAPAGDTGGWPLGKSVRVVELLAIVARVEGVVAVPGVRLAHRGAAEADWSEAVERSLRGLQLPHVDLIDVRAGLPADPLLLVTSAPGAGRTPGTEVGSLRAVPVPRFPEEC